MDNQMSIGVVHIVEWLNPGDAETGESLFKELQPIGAAFDPKVEIHFHRIASRIFVLGHSLGGMLVPRIAAAARLPVAGFIVMADASKPDLLFGAAPSYWLDLRGYDPPAAAAQVEQPMFVLQGERDYQVTMAEYTRWRSALAGRPDVTFHSYPSLNHLFVAGTGMSLPAEYNMPGHVSEDVVRDIATWIMGVAPRRR